MKSTQTFPLSSNLKTRCRSANSLTVTFALLLWVGVVKKSLPVMSPGHAAELDSLQAIVQERRAFHPEEVDLHPV